MTTRRTLGKNIAKRVTRSVRTYRKTTGTTQVALAKSSGICQMQLSQIELGRTKNPSMSLILGLSKAMNKPVSEIIGVKVA